MIVETHSHISVPIAGAETPSRHNYGSSIEGIEQYLRSYEQNNVDACWVFGSRSWRVSELIRPENDALAQLRKQHPERLFPWGSVNPNWAEDPLRQEIRRIARDLHLCGLKLVPIIQGTSLSAPGVDVVAEEAAREGLPVFFHDGSPEYCSGIQVAYFARKHPDLRVVSGHGGLRELWPDLIPAARELPNLWICLSGPTQWGIQKTYDEVGPEKLFFGSDGGLGHPAIIKAYLRRIERLNAPPEHKKMILGENAARFLSMPRVAE